MPTMTVAMAALRIVSVSLVISARELQVHVSSLRIAAMVSKRVQKVVTMVTAHQVTVVRRRVRWNLDGAFSCWLSGFSFFGESLV